MTIPRRALRRNPTPAAQIARPINWIAPLKGLRTDVPLSNMPPDAASTLVNFFPEAGYLRTRNGSQPWTTSGPGNAVRTLAPYSGSAQKLFSFHAGGATFDVTSAGAGVNQTFPLTAATTPVSYTNFTNAGGHWLIGVTGLDTPFTYSGSAWATTAIVGTGLADPTKLFAVTAYRSRLYFLEKNTTNLWFLDTNAITGGGGAAGAATTPINLGTVMKFGGLPIAINSWTSQVQTGVMQFLVIMTSEGELIVYTGSNPTDATNFSLLGTFKLGYPLGGINCMYPIGADLAIMTVDGIVPISQAITLDPSATDQASLTKNIAPTWLQIVQTVGRNTTGWQFLTYPSRRMAIINVPDPVIGTYQLVMNTETFAWTQFTGMAATNWAVFNGSLYFGTAISGSYVMQGDVGSADTTAPIDCLMAGAWTRLNDGLAPKSTTLIGVDCIMDTSAAVYAGASFDYKVSIPASVGVGSGSASVALWDVALWDVDVWPGAAPRRLIADASGFGVVFAPTVRVLLSGSASAPSTCVVIGGAIHIQQGSGI